MPEAAGTLTAGATPAGAGGSPAGGPGGAGAPAKGTTTALGDAYSDLDKMVERSNEEAGGEGNGEGEGKTADGLEDKGSPGDQQPEPTAEEKAQAAKDAAAAAAGKEKPATLRKALDSTKAELQKANARVAELEAKIKTPQEDPEKKKLSETLAQRDARIREMEEDQKYTDYERSGEYAEKYFKPFESAYNAGRAKVASFKLVAEDGTARQGTPEDFDNFMRITDDDQAAETAATLFGNKAASVMYHREHVQSLNNARQEALADFRKNGAERTKQRTEAAAATNKKVTEETTNYWKKHGVDAIEAHPHIFKEITGDDVGNQLLQKGFKQAQEAFAHLNPLDPRLTPEQREAIVEKHAVVFNKAAAFDRTWHLLSQERKQVKELRKQLDAYKKSTPGGGNGNGRGTGGGNGSANATDSAMAALGKLAR